MEETDPNSLKQFSDQSDDELRTLQYMLDISLDIICTIDIDGKFRYVSKSCFSILGYSQEELRNKEFLLFVLPEDIPKTKKAAEDIQNGTDMTNFENRYLHKNGSIIPILWSAKWDTKTNLMYCVAKDASAIKKLEIEKENERKNKEALINGTDTLIWSFNTNLELVSANNTFLNSVKDFTGKLIKKGQNLMDESFFNAQHLSFWRQPYAQVLRGEQVQIEMEVPTRNNGQTFWIKTEIQPIRESDKIVGGVCRVFDITTSKNNEFEIKNLNSKLNEAQEFAKLGYWELNLHDKTLFWSDEIYKIWELDKNTFQPNLDSLLKTIHHSDLAYYQQRHEKALNGIESLDNLVYRIISGSGTVKWVKEIGGLVKRASPNNIDQFKGIVQEVTSQKEIELELKQRNKFIESIFQHIPMGIAVNKINEGTAILMNKEFSKVYGWPEDVLTDVSSFFTKIYPDIDYREKMVTEITEDMNSGDIERMQWKDISITTQQGDIKYVDAKNIPLPEQNLMISTVIDVTGKMKSKLAMENALKERNVVLESISDAFYALNKNYEFTYLNQTALKLFNKTGENLLGKNLFKEFPELKNTIFFNYLQEVKQENKSRSFELYYSLYDSWFDENIYPTQEGYSVFFKDITDRKLITKELENAYESNQEILESISDAFYAIDKEFNFTYFNAEAEKILNISNSEALGKNIWELFEAAVNTKLYFEYKKVIENKETRSFEYYYPPLKTWFHIKAYPSENGLSAYFRDITEEKRNQRKMETMNIELKDRAKELEYINKELEQFAFIASHDLQEPLRMITSFMSLLKNKYGADLNEKANTYMDFAIDGGTRMRQIIIDLLEYSRAGNPSNFKEEIDLNKIVKDVISLHRSTIQNKKAEIEVNNLPNIQYYKIGIQQVFQNILSNALKYSKKDDKPKITISCQEHEEEFQITIADNGIGIKEEYQEKIFIIFQRLHNKSEYGGTGLGLAICKKIIEKGGGRIWVESVFGEGTTFHFTLPKK